jgi:hypothetical protein
LVTKVLDLDIQIGLRPEKKDTKVKSNVWDS